MNEDRVAELMVKVVDGLATAEEGRELERAVALDPELAAELAAHSALKDTTDGWVQRLVLDEVEDAWAGSPVTRVERGVGLILVVAGVSMLAGFGMWELWLDPGAPLWLKLGSVMTMGGLAVLLGSVVRWKWLTRRDPYDEVVR